MSESKELVAIDQKNVMQVFTQEGHIDPILKGITEQVRGLVFDMSTAKGRKECASAAHKVAQCKTYLDGLGKDLVAEMKELPKKVDANRKVIREYLDALKEEVRAPLDAWEDEQARIAEEMRLQIEAERLAKQLESDWEIAILMDREFDRVAEEKRQAAEQARIEHERRIAEDAAERALREAEQRAEAERQAAARREAEARLAQERAEREAAESRQRAERAEREAEERAKHAAEQARQQEIARQRAAEQSAAEAKAKADAEEQVRQRNLEHRKTINRQALGDLVENGVGEEIAKAVIKLIAAGKISNIKMEY